MNTLDTPQFITDPEGSILKTNLSFARLLGYEKGSLTGIPFIDLIYVSASIRRFITFNKLHHLSCASETPMKISLKNRQGKGF